MRGKPAPEKDHCHTCPWCKVRYGCAFTGCKGDDWEWKVCGGCWLSRHKQSKPADAPDEPTAEVLKET